MMAYLKLMRPLNGLMAGVAAVTGFLIASGYASISTLPGALASWLLFASAFLFTSASMAINDYFDREVDKLNQPGRPIPSGKVKPEEALLLSLALLSAGLAVSALLGPGPFAIAVAASALLVAYSACLKRLGLLGNAAVSFCVALTFMYGSAASSAPTSTVLTFSSMAFLANMSREVVKGIADVEGDGLRGVKTLAVARGLRFAAGVALIFMVLAAAVSALPVVCGCANLIYIPLILVSDAGLMASTLRVLAVTSTEEARRSKNLMLAFMSLALIAFLLGCVEP
ncbi:MAG: geranylgeranylglycerol-phosphate geranylgeranyltransferase [Desulfurococcaceae archaeon]